MNVEQLDRDGGPMARARVEAIEFFDRENIGEDPSALRRMVFKLLIASYEEEVACLKAMIRPPSIPVYRPERPVPVDPTPIHVCDTAETPASPTGKEPLQVGWSNLRLCGPVPLALAQKPAMQDSEEPSPVEHADQAGRAKVTHIGALGTFFQAVQPPAAKTARKRGGNVVHGLNESENDRVMSAWQRHQDVRRVITSLSKSITSANVRRILRENGVDAPEPVASGRSAALAKARQAKQLKRQPTAPKAGDRQSSTATKPLTPQEIVQVVRSAAQGNSEKSIAQIYGLSLESTNEAIETYSGEIQELMEKPSPYARSCYLEDLLKRLCRQVKR